MTPERRLKRFPVSLESLAGFLKGTMAARGRALPADAAILAAHWHAELGALLVTVHSLSYEPVPPTMTIPIDNAPILSEIPS